MEMVPSFQQRARFASQVRENALRDVARQVRRGHLPQGRRIDQIGVPHDQLTKRAFVPIFGVFSQQLRIRLLVHLTIKQPPPGKSDKDLKFRWATSRMELCYEAGASGIVRSRATSLLQRSLVYVFGVACSSRT